MLTPATPIILSSISWLCAGAGMFGIAQAVSGSNPIWAALIGPILIMALLVAPYQVWKEERRRADDAERRLRPEIDVCGVVVPGPSDKTACIRVMNRGTEPIRNCIGYLWAVHAEIDGRLVEETAIQRANLQWSARSGGRAGSGAECRLTFTREADLDVAVLEITTDRITLVVCDDKLRAQYSLPEQPAYVFDVEIAPENSASRRERYRLTINPIGSAFKYDEGPIFRVLGHRELPELTFDVVKSS